MKEIQLNPQQVEAVSHKDGPMIVLSVAGSGKTMVLIERIFHLIPANKRGYHLTEKLPVGGPK